MRKQITFGIGSFIFLSIFFIFLGIFTALQVNEIIENQEYTGYLLNLFTFIVLIIVVIRVNLRKYKN